MAYGDDYVDDDGHHRKGGNTIIREILREGGLAMPAEPIFEAFWLRYQKRKKCSPLSLSTVVDHRADDTPVTLGECWLFELRMEIKQAMSRLRTDSSFARNDDL